MNVRTSSDRVGETCRSALSGKLARDVALSMLAGDVQPGQRPGRRDRRLLAPAECRERLIEKRCES